VKFELRDYVIVPAATAVFTAIVTLAVFALDYQNLIAAPPDLYRISVRNDILAPLLFGAPTFFFMFWKLRQLAKIRKILELLAFTDDLTKIFNRRAFEQAVEAALDVEEAKNIAMMVIDVDHFKQINDNFGHNVGDEALVALVRAIQACLRPEDIFGRIGGEEFAVFGKFATPDLAVLQAERLRLAVQDCGFGKDMMTAAFTVSIGLTHTTVCARYGELYRKADLCLYEAKETGRNRVVSMDLFERRLSQPLPIEHARA
jgi:diguanylate cyclase